MSKVKEEFFTARGYEIAAGEDALTRSMEDYMEMIFRLSRDSGYTRVNDLAESLNVQPSSVTKMMQKLDEKSLLNYEKYGMIHLTEEGKQLGEYLLARHNTLYQFLQMLGVKENLHKDVEGIEHNLSFETLQIIFAMVDFFKENPKALADFHQHRAQYLKKI